MKNGTLYIIASPIGNLEDITLRALNVLKNDVELLYCEDTRQTRKLLNHYEIKLETRSLHSHSSIKQLENAITVLKSGKSIGYITDSGTPALSDPGSKLVTAAREENINIMPLPGPSALTTILSVSGFHEKNAIFAGFLSKKDGKKRKELQKLKEFNGTIVLYESPYRIKKLLNIINEIFPDSDILIGREMTKYYEDFIHGKVSDIFNNIENITEKGEFTISINNSHINKDKNPK